MGYDMSAIKPPSETPKDWHPTGWYDDPWYFRLNVSGGTAMVREVLEPLGVIDNMTPAPRFPEYPGSEHFDRHDEPITVPGHEYAAGVTATVSTRGVDGKVPPWKLCGSNDGWVIHPEECEVIARALAGHPASWTFNGDRWNEIIRSFRDFNALCGQHAGGYRVN